MSIRTTARTASRARSRLLYRAGDGASGRVVKRCRIMQVEGRALMYRYQVVECRSALDHFKNFARIMQAPDGCVQLGSLRPGPLEIAEPHFDASVLMTGRDTDLQFSQVIGELTQHGRPFLAGRRRVHQSADAQSQERVRDGAAPDH